MISDSGPMPCIRCSCWKMIQRSVDSLVVGKQIGWGPQMQTLWTQMVIIGWGFDCMMRATMKLLLQWHCIVSVDITLIKLQWKNRPLLSKLINTIGWGCKTWFLTDWSRWNWSRSQGRDPNILLHNTQMQQLDQLRLEVGQEVSVFEVKE